MNKTTTPGIQQRFHLLASANVLNHFTEVVLEDERVIFRRSQAQLVEMSKTDMTLLLVLLVIGIVYVAMMFNSLLIWLVTGVFSALLIFATFQEYRRLPQPFHYLELDTVTSEFVLAPYDGAAVCDDSKRVSIDSIVEIYDWSEPSGGDTDYSIRALNTTGEIITLLDLYGGHERIQTATQILAFLCQKKAFSRETNGRILPLASVFSILRT